MHLSSETRKYTLNKENFFRNTPFKDKSLDDSLISENVITDKLSRISTKEILSTFEFPTVPHTERNSVRTFRSQNDRLPMRKDSREMKVVSMFSVGETIEEEHLIIPSPQQTVPGLLTSVTNLFSCFRSCS